MVKITMKDKINADNSLDFPVNETTIEHDKSEPNIHSNTCDISTTQDINEVNESMHQDFNNSASSLEDTSSVVNAHEVTNATEETESLMLSPISSVYADSDFDPLNVDPLLSDSSLSKLEQPGTSKGGPSFSNKLSVVRKMLCFDDNEKSYEISKYSSLQAVFDALTRMKTLRLSSNNSKDNSNEIRAVIDIYETIITVEVFKILHNGIYKAILKLERRDENTLGYTCCITDKQSQSKSHECVFARKEQKNICITQRSSTTEMEFQLNNCLETKSYLSGQEHYFIPTYTYIGILHLTNNRPQLKNFEKKKNIYGTKRHHCFFCSKLITHVSRHILSVHREEKEVKEIMQMSLDDNNRIKRLKKLRLEGDK